MKVKPGREARKSLGASADFGTDTAGAGSALSRPTGLAATTFLPSWTYQMKAAQDGNTYAGVIVGSALSSSVTVPTVLVPVALKITQGAKTYTFDPTLADYGCLAGNQAFSLMQNSPLFQNAAFTFNGVNVGTTQYTDAFLRSEFWTNIQSGYHLLLNTSTGPKLTLTINAGSGNTTATIYSVGSQCGNSGTANPANLLAVVNVNTIDAYLQQYISAHGLNGSQLPVFVLYNSVISNGAANSTGNCCILGYHNALSNPGQTYAIAEFEGRNQTLFSGVSDISAASHELAEWADDPYGTNPTPSWGNVGQVSGSCQNDFEVGDPLSGTLMPPVSLNGFTYHVQELAYASWFYGGSSIGAGGKYSSNGTFGGYAKLCPPGGTN